MCRQHTLQGAALRSAWLRLRTQHGLGRKHRLVLLDVAQAQLAGAIGAPTTHFAATQQCTRVLFAGGDLDGVGHVDHLGRGVGVVSAAGVARPWPLIKALTQDKRFFLRHFIVTVDALNLHRDFADGRALTGESAASGDAAMHRAAEVLVEQIAFANVIILTKVDTIPEDTAAAQVKSLQKLQPNATIGLSAQAGILLPQLEATAAPKVSLLEERAKEFGLTQESSIAENVEALVLRDPRPFHPERLYEACTRKMGTGLYRTKGFLWLASRSGHVLLWQQSGSQIALELTGLWRAEIVQDPEGKLLPEEIEHLKAQLESKHPVFGDRHNELTFIGLKADLDSFASALKEALCTDEEIMAWQEGETFTDPWPKSIRSIE